MKTKTHRKKKSFSAPKGEVLLVEILSLKVSSDSQYSAIYKDSNGEYHHPTGPAIIHRDGTKEWFIHGVRHRVGGPAIQFSDGTESWFVKGKRHRTDGPAITESEGITYWYQHDELHRTDGPALVYDDGRVFYYRYGRAIYPPAKTHPRYMKEYDQSLTKGE